MEWLTEEDRIGRWHDDKWNKSDAEVALKLCEEAGEVGGAVIKRDEGRRTDQDLRDELGDLLIVASVLASRLGTTLHELRHNRFLEVEQRVFQ